MGDTLVSVLVPSRSRPAALARAVDSLLSRAVTGRVEVLVRVDDDETGLYPPLPGVTMVDGPSWGYRGMHRYFNELAALAQGQWLFVFNDDALCRARRWDEKLAAMGSEFRLLATASNHGTTMSPFPIVPKAWYDVLGHLSPHAQIDAWTEHVAREVGIREEIDLYVLHDRADLTGHNRDATFAARRYEAFTRPQDVAGRATDVQRLKAFLAQSEVQL
jgi:hypothetical protein